MFAIFTPKSIFNMNLNLNHWILVCMLGLAALALGSCQDDCIEDLPDVVLGTQTFTVEYQTQDGTNYIQNVYNAGNLQVTADYSGGDRTNGGFDERFRPGTNGTGQFGPFYYTERYIDSVTNLPLLSTYSRIIRHDYYILKDTFGTDKLSVEFWISTDNCNTKWESIRYFLNDEELTEYDMQENADIVIVE